MVPSLRSMWGRQDGRATMPPRVCFPRCWEGMPRCSRLTVPDVSQASPMLRGGRGPSGRGRTPHRLMGDQDRERTPQGRWSLTCFMADCIGHITGGRGMRIALDARKLTTTDSGIGNYTLNLARALLEEDKAIELLLICRTTHGRGRLQDPRVTEVVFPFPPMSPVTQFALGPFLRRQHFDVFHSPLELAPWRLHRPVVVTIHDLHWIVNPRYHSHNLFFRLAGGVFFRAGLTAAMRAASRILAISHATQHAILEYAPWHASKIRVAYNGIDRSRIYPMEKAMAYRTLAHLIEPGTPFVLTVGQGSPYKNHLNAVRGFLEAFGH